jgi:hypothetical protein
MHQGKDFIVALEPKYMPHLDAERLHERFEDTCTNSAWVQSFSPPAAGQERLHATRRLQEEQWRPEIIVAMESCHFNFNTILI